jgi:nucleoid DNA-binding protein
MNKSEFISAVASKIGLTQADAGRAVDAVLAIWRRGLSARFTVRPETPTGVFARSRLPARF